MSCDERDNIWIGHIHGLTIYDGITERNFFTPSDSGYGGDRIWSLAADNSGNTWVGGGTGLYRFNGYNLHSINFPYPYDVGAIAIDKNDHVWVVHNYFGLAKYDGTNWTTFYDDYPGDYFGSANAMVIDDNDNIWIGSGNLRKFDGTYWTDYTITSTVSSLAIDDLGNLWVGTEGGLFVHREGGVIFKK